MKKIAILSAATLFAMPFTLMAQSQDETKTLKRISIKNVFIQNSSFNLRSPNATFSDFTILAPQSNILNSVDQSLLNSNNYNSFSYGNSFGSSNNILSGSLGLQFADKNRESYKSNPLLRLGMSYSNSSSYSGYFSTTQRTAADTLTSSQNGSKVYVDSVNTNNYYATYSSEQIRLDASLLFRTNPAARWSLYSGIGFSLGFSINANTQVDYYKSQYLESRYPDGSTAITNNGVYFGNENDNHKSELFRNKRNRTSSIYIPLGLDFRIGNKNEFWKRMHLYYEIKAGIYRTNIQELRKYTNVGVQQGLGIRYSWE